MNITEKILKSAAYNVKAENEGNKITCSLVIGTNGKIVQIENGVITINETTVATFNEYNGNMNVSFNVSGNEEKVAVIGVIDALKKKVEEVSTATTTEE